MPLPLGRDETAQSGLATPSDIRILEAYDKGVSPYKVGRDPESCLFLSSSSLLQTFNRAFVSILSSVNFRFYLHSFVKSSSAGPPSFNFNLQYF